MGLCCCMPVQILGGVYVKYIYRMPGGFIVGDSGLCCCVRVQIPGGVSVPCIYPMPGRFIVGDSGLCCCVPIQPVTSLGRCPATRPWIPSCTREGRPASSHTDISAAQAIHRLLEGIPGGLWD